MIKRECCAHPSPRTAQGQFTLLQYSSIISITRMRRFQPDVVAKWRQRQAEAQSQPVPEGTSRNDYELPTSLTNMMPMHGWCIEHAAREFWQNTVDGCTDVFGEVKPVRANPDCVQLVTAAEAVPVAWVDSTRPGTLSIKQNMAVLLPKHLLLGSFIEGQTLTAGCHGTCLR
jgi:hypothetical protein